MAWKPIVVGVDASPEAAQAATFAARAAERGRTTCHLVHATRDPLASLSGMEDARYRRAVLDLAREQVLTALGDALPGALLDTLDVRAGAAAGVLKEVVAERGAELVVLGGKRHSALGRWLGGSTSLHVARTSDVPLLVTTGSGPAQRVLAALDLSAAARPTLAAAERCAALLGAELRVVSVMEPLPIIPEVTPPYDAVEYYAMAEEMLKRDVWSLVRDPRVERVLRYGMAVETLSREAAEWGADLLVVGSHGKGWAERALLGSVTERLLNHLPTSLLVVPVTVALAAERQEAPAAARSQPAIAIA